MEDRRLATNAELVDHRTRIHIRSTIKQQFGGIDIPVLRGHVEQGRPPKFEAARAGVAKIKFGETSVRQSGFGIQVLGQKIEPGAKQVQNGRNIVLRDSACAAKDVVVSISVGDDVYDALCSTLPSCLERPYVPITKSKAVPGYLRWGSAQFGLAP